MTDSKDTFAQAQRVTQISNLITATLAMGIGLDPVSAYIAVHNANEHNTLAHHKEYLEDIGVIDEETDEPAKVVQRASRTKSKASAIRRARSSSPSRQTIVEEINDGTRQVEEGIAVMQQSIAGEVALRLDPNTSLLEKTASYIREASKRQMLQDACKALTLCQSGEAAVRLVKGKSTAHDKHLLLVGISTALAGYATRRAGGGVSLGTKVLDVWGVIFNQSLDTPNESISAPH